MCFLLLAVCAVAAVCLEHECIHDAVQRRLDVRQALRTSALLQSVDDEFADNATYAPMRIAISDLNLLNTSYYCTAAGDVRPNYQGGSVTCTSADVLTNEMRQLLRDDIVPTAVEWLSSELSVVPRQGNITATGTICSPNVLVSADDAAWGIDADFAIFITAAPVTGNTIAFAAHCTYNPADNRPLTGIINFNPRLLLSQTSSSLHRVALHELHHALGFSYAFMSQIVPQGTFTVETRRGGNHTIVATGSVVDTAQAYFECPTLTGPELEDEGGAATALSHWERRSLRDELMAGIIGESRLTNFTLDLMEALGFYRSNRSMAESQQWFARSGCAGHTAYCNTTAGGAGTWFCFDPQLLKCTPNRRSGGQCGISDNVNGIPFNERYFAGLPLRGGSAGLMNYCPVVSTSNVCDTPRPDNLPAAGNYYGEHGRCVTTSRGLVEVRFSLTGGLPYRCLRLRCPNNSFVQFQLGADPTAPWTSCPTDGLAATIDVTPLGYRGNVTCPTAAAVCADSSLYYGGAVGPSPTAPPLTTDGGGTVPADEADDGLTSRQLGLIIGVPVAAAVVTLIVVAIVVRASRTTTEKREPPPQHLDRHFMLEG